MNEYVILVMTIVALCAAVCAVSVISSAVENIRIAKHTGRDPRKTRTTMTLNGTGENTSQAVVDAGERLARDGAL